MSLCTRCGAEFTAPAGLEMSLNIRASYCEKCAADTNAKFSALFGGAR